MLSKYLMIVTKVALVFEPYLNVIVFSFVSDEMMRNMFVPLGVKTQTQRR